MNIQEIISRINENSRLLSDGSISEIERDILLEDLRSLYLLVKGTVASPALPVVIEQPKVEEVAKPIVKIIEEPVVPVEEEKPVEVPEVIVAKVEEKVEAVQPVQQSRPEPIHIEFVQEEPKVKTGSSLNEIFAGEEKSLNTKLSGEKKPSALNDHVLHKDLKSMIDFNKQYLLTNELFKGDGHAFNNAINHINDVQSIEEAFEYIKTELMPKYNWKGDMQSARLFDKLVRQKFGLI